MTLFVQYFIPYKQFYMFRVKHSPIIRSSNKLITASGSDRQYVHFRRRGWVGTHLEPGFNNMPHG
jgi:hypothetical protein